MNAGLGILGRVESLPDVSLGPTGADPNHTREARGLFSRETLPDCVSDCGASHSATVLNFGCVANAIQGIYSIVDTGWI